MQLRPIGTATLLVLAAALAGPASAAPWACTVWQWNKSAKLNVGSFTLDPDKIESQQLPIDGDTTASCTGQMDRQATTALLVCSVYTESTHYAARGMTGSDGSYLLVSGNRTDQLIDNQIECSPAVQARR